MTATGFHCYKQIDLCYAWSVLCFVDANMPYCAQDSAHVLDTISNMLTFILYPICLCYKTMIITLQ